MFTDSQDSEDAGLTWALGCLGQVLVVQMWLSEILPHACQLWVTELVSGHTEADGCPLSVSQRAGDPKGWAMLWPAVDT